MSCQLMQQSCTSRTVMLLLQLVCGAHQGALCWFGSVWQKPVCSTQYLVYYQICDPSFEQARAVFHALVLHVHMSLPCMSPGHMSSYACVTCQPCALVTCHSCGRVTCQPYAHVTCQACCVKHALTHQHMKVHCQDVLHTFAMAGDASCINSLL